MGKVGLLRKLLHPVRDEGGDVREPSSHDSDLLSVGIVGAGEIVDRNRADIFATAAGVELHSIFDIREWAAEDIAGRHGAAATDSFEELLADPDIDVVHIATPHQLHAEQAIAAAKAGKHVLVEKPLATDPATATEVVDTFERHDAELSVLLLRRFRPEVRKARELLSSGVIGDPVGFRIERMSLRKTDRYWEGGYSGRIESAWRSSKTKSGGGVLVMNAIHDVDELLFLSGLEPSRVYCEYDTFAAPDDIEDFVTATIRFRNGGIGSLEASTCVDGNPDASPVRYNKIYGSDGTIVLDDDLWVYTHQETECGPPNEWHRYTFEEGTSTVELGSQFLSEFVGSVDRDDCPPCPGTEQRRVLTLLDAAYESGRTHEPVALD